MTANSKLDTPGGQVITFYSYKGGTGRSMALANCACLLARGAVRDISGMSGPQRVIAIDWDLEAPGLHSYFRGIISQDGGPGLLDLFERLNTATSSWDAGDRDASRSRMADLLERIDLESYLSTTKIPGLFLMPAGSFGDRYAARVNSFPWQELHRRVPGLFSAFVEWLAARHDYILIDSRTGLSDISGICTTLLPEKLVVVFTPNEQSLTGIADLVRMAAQYRRSSDDWRSLSVFPLPSRVEMARPTLLELWRFGTDNDAGNTGTLKGFQPRFQELLLDVFSLGSCDLTEYFDEVQLQHVPDYAYGEPLPVETERETRLSLRRSYENFVERLISLAGPWENLLVVREQRELDQAVDLSARSLESGSVEYAESLLYSALDLHGAQPMLVSPSLAEALARAADARRERGDLEAALRLNREALVVAGRAFSEDGPAMTKYLDRLAEVLEEDGNFREGLKHVGEALALRERIFGEADPSLARTLLTRARLLGAAGQRDDALQDLQRAAQLARSTSRLDDPERASIYSSLGETFASLGDHRQAQEYFERSFSILQGLHAEAPEAASVLRNLARSARLSGNAPAARGYLDRALRLLEASREDRSATTADVLDEIATFAARSGDMGEAQESYQRALRIREKVLGPNHPDTIISMMRLADLAARIGKNEEAEAQYDRALDYAGSLLGEDHKLVADIRMELGKLFLREDRFEEAEKLTRQSLTTFQRRGDIPSMAEAFRQLGQVAHVSNRLVEAREFYGESLDLAMQLGDRLHEAECCLYLGTVDHQDGNSERAQAWYERALNVAGQLRYPRIIGEALGRLAAVAFEKGDNDQALLRAFGVLNMSAGGQEASTDLPREVVVALYQRLGESGFVNLWQKVVGEAPHADFLGHIKQISDSARAEREASSSLK